MYEFIKTSKNEIDDNNLEKEKCIELLEPIFINKNSSIIPSNLYTETDFFDNNGNKDNSVFSKINKCKTFFGEMYLKNKLLNPKISYIKEPIVKENNIEFLEYIKKHQKCLISFLDPINPIYENIYIHKKVVSLLKHKNLKDSSQYIYNCFNLFLPLYNIFSLPIVLVLFAVFKKYIPEYLLPKIKYMIDMSFMGLTNLNIFKVKTITGLIKTILYIGFFIYNIYSSIKFSVLTYILRNKIIEKLDIIKTIIKKTQEMFTQNSYNSEPLSVIDLTYKHNGEAMNKYMGLFKSEKLVSYIKYIGLIDYNNNRQLLRKSGYSLPNSIKLKKPLIIFKKMGNPLLDNSVKNSISIHDNILITGPNACGKSTFIKSLTINILLAQTIGLCYSKYMLFTPFSYIDTQIYNTDEIGKLSLFQNQIKRMDDYIEKIKNTDGFVFSVIDELFNATNYKDSEKVSDIYCNKLLNNKSITIITTHLDKITKKRPKFKNYKMVITKNLEGLKFTYKIKEGVNTESSLSHLI